MAKRTFPEGFREKAIAYPAEHPEKSMKQCAADLGIGYSTLRRWINEAEEAEVAQHVGKEAVSEEAAAADKVSEAPAEYVAQVPEATAANDAEPVTQDAATAADTDAADETPEEVAAAEEDAQHPAPSEEAPQPEEESVAETSSDDDWEDDVAFASVGAYTKQDNTMDDDFTFRCKANTSAYKDIQHMAGDVVVSVTAQIGNAVEDVTKSVSTVAERLGLYKKRYELEKARRKIKKEKEKRQKS